MTKAYIIHENESWILPLREALEEMEVPHEFWHLDEGALDLSQRPPQGIFYNRMSASSHSRNHRYAPEYTSNVLAWLEHHGRTVLNTSRALELEVNKVKQYLELQKFGIETPATIAAVGKKAIVEAANNFPYRSFITKHNRAGKGLGVYLFESIDSLETYVDSEAFEESIDGVTLIQQYIRNEEHYITRCEFIDGKFYYAVRVDTSEGFQLCPADACQIGDQYCPVGEEEQARKKFEVIDGFNSPLIPKYEAFLAQNGISFAGIEFITDSTGRAYTYDVNTNTNYNPEAESLADVSGMKEIARILSDYLKREIQLGS
ncbi:alpha-L-glutamate ligase [Paenibacillus sp. FSL H7-0326]|uniref:ATP-grasp domain-containing protein n=1 Tax=Paenibacillus sp. FSL H7-0326 TaxID=1921144 RepID=UPI00096F32FC|nr:alpha-L-glutamate ligase [Paenibacillus sp. FSL H7-0326]OMC67184.1 alpha-L-glutamate ligase [Paenibacillus sp. FSL H7-0326]